MVVINPINYLVILKLQVGAICNAWHKRGGELWCSQNGDRVMMKGKAVFYMKGEITI